MARKTINITLLLILLVAIVVAIFLWRINSQKVVISENPLTGKREVSGEEAPVDRGVVRESNYRPSLLSDQRIFDLGLRSSEYHTIIRSLDTYTKKKYGEKKHITYTIDSSSVEYSEENKTFTFRMEVEKNSNKFFDVTIERPKFNFITVILRDGENVVYNQTEKINSRL